MNDADLSRTAAAANPLEPELARLVALARYGGLDRSPDPAGERAVALQRIAATARTGAGLDAGVVVLVGRDEQRVLAAVGAAAADLGFEAGARLPRSQVCGADALELRNTLSAPDAAAHPALARHPLVVRPGGVRSVLGAPIVSPDGHALGLVLALGRRPRERFDGAAVALQWLLAAEALELLAPPRLAQAS